MSGWEDDKTAWYENLGGGKFSAQRAISTDGDGARSLFAADMDGDGDADVLSASWYKIGWYENLSNHGDDHGDSPEAATLTTALPAFLHGVIESEGDCDVFRVATGGGTLRIYSNGPTDTVGALLYPDGRAWTVANDTGSGRNFLIETTVRPGVHYVEVTGPIRGPYTLSIEFVADGTPVVPTPPTDDHGNGAESGTTLSLNWSLDGVIENSGDTDWLRIETSAPRVLKIRTTGSLDTVGSLFDVLLLVEPERKPLAEDDHGGGGDNFALQAEVPSGVYYVRVRAFGPGTGTYRIEEHGEAVYVAPTEGQPGRIVSVAGTGTAGYSGDGELAVDAQLDLPLGVAVDADGNVFIADSFNKRVRQIDPSGTITTVAGTGQADNTGDGGLATNAGFTYPGSLAVDADGNLYIGIRTGHRVRRVDRDSGVVTTVAGTGQYGYCGDGGPATEAELAGFSGGNAGCRMVVDGDGNLFVADRHRVRRVDRSGTIATIAGTGQASASGDGGPALQASLKSPNCIAVDRDGNLYIGTDYRVRRVDRSTGVITTVAGTGEEGYSGDDGPATSAAIATPTALAVDADGNLYIADPNNNRVRKVIFSGGVAQPTPMSDDRADDQRSAELPEGVSPSGASEEL